MDSKTFDELLERRLGLTKEVLASKNKEYSSPVDRLHNFKEAARIGIGDITPEVALWGMLSKHIVSVMDIIEATEAGRYPDRATIDEKLGDMINYTILLEALLMDSES